MDVEYSAELAEYMRRKGYRDILIETYCAHTCSGQPNLVVRPVDQRESQVLRERGANCLHGELGDVFVGAMKLPVGDDDKPAVPLRLGLKSFLGAKEITVEGLRPQGLFD